MRLSLLTFASIAALVSAAPGLAYAQDESPHDVAARIHHEGGYPSDVTPASQDVDPALDGAGAGRGPAGDTRLDREREAGDSGTGGDDALGPAIQRFFEWLGGLFGALGALSWVLLALGLVLVMLLVGYIATRLRLGSSSTSSAVDASASDAPLDPMLVGPTESADTLAAQGRYGEAIHALFLGALRHVGGREGRHRGRTARELVRDVDAGRAGHAELGQLLDLTELVWFGGRAATADQYHHARALAEHVPAAQVGETRSEDA